MRHSTSGDLPIFRSTIVGAVTSGLYPGRQPLSPLEAVMTAATGCNASARVSALVPGILKRLMAKDKTETNKASRSSVDRRPQISSSNGQRVVKPTRRRWDPVNVSAEFNPPAVVLESELKAVEAFLKDDLNELLGRSSKFCVNQKDKTQ